MAMGRDGGVIDLRTPAGRPRVVELHASRWCNQQCRHCCSSSGPHQRGALALDVVRAALDDAAALGYRTLAVSGGEPFLYVDLAEVLAYARDLGLATEVTTNGTLFGGGRLEAVGGLIDRLLVSVDGPPDLHNAVRASASAFDELVDGLARLRAGGRPFGMATTVTERSWPHLAWVGQLAAEQGATRLRVRALEPTGRAAFEMGDDLPGPSALANAYIMGGALRLDYAERMAVEVELVHRRAVEADPEALYAGPDGPDPMLDPAAALGTLVVEDDGVAVPLGYGFGRRFAVADLTRDRLVDAWPAFAVDAYPALRRLCGAVRERMLASSRPVFAWPDLVTRASQSAGVPVLLR